MTNAESCLTEKLPVSPHSLLHEIRAMIANDIGSHLDLMNAVAELDYMLCSGAALPQEWHQSIPRSYIHESKFSNYLQGKTV